MSSTEYKEQSEPPSRGGSALPPSRFARACTRCRQQKLACKPGSSGMYPCLRCEDTDSQCILVEKQRPTPAPTLSSKISKQEASLSDLTSQLTDIQRQLASLSDVHSRLTALERQARASTVQSSQNAYHQPSPARTDAASSSRRPPSQGEFSPMRTVLSIPKQDGGDGRSLVRDFERGDIGSNRLLTDVRMYLSGRGTKRKRVEDDTEAWLMAMDIFNQRCLSAVNFCHPDDLLVSPQEMRDRSPLLFWAIVAVGSRETPELYDVYVSAHESMLGLLRETLGGPKPSLWDLIGAMVWNKWLSPVRPIGHIVDLAYELDLHRAYDMIKKNATLDLADLGKVRMWISVCIQDFFSATMTGRPPHYHDRGFVLEQAKWLVNQPGVLRNDWRLLATYEYESIAHSIQEQTSRVDLIGDDWRDIIESRLEAIDDWYARWEPIATSKSDPEDTVSFIHSVKLNVHLAKLAVLSVFLRGIRTVADLTPERLRYIGMAVESARAECHVCVTDFQAPAIQYLAETQLYGFVSAAVLLLKVVWLLPQAYDSEQIFKEVEDVIDTLRAVSGQLHAHFVSQILRHVRENHRVAMAGVPTLMPTAEEYTSKPDSFERATIVGTPLVGPLTGDGLDQFNSVNGQTPGVNLANGLGSGFNTGEVNNDFWNWLSSTGQAFSPLPTGFDGFDSAIGLGGV